MESKKEKPIEKGVIANKIAEGKNDATEGFANSKNGSAPEINQAGDAKTRHYMNKEGDDPQGPNWDRKSKAAVGDTSSTAGVFK